MNRAWNLRARADYLQLDRSSDEDVRDASTHTRYALESEWVPVPFAELRFTARRILHNEEAPPFPLNETQGYVQFHFSY